MVSVWHWPCQPPRPNSRPPHARTQLHTRPAPRKTFPSLCGSGCSMCLHQPAPAPAPATALTCPLCSPLCAPLPSPPLPRCRTIKYLYDGDCSMCLSLVSMLRRQDEGAGRIMFVNIASMAYQSAENEGILYEEAMEVGGVGGWVGGWVGRRAGGWVLPAVTDWPALAGGCCEG